MRTSMGTVLAAGLVTMAWAVGSFGYELKVVNTSGHELSAYPVVVRLDKLSAEFRSPAVVVTDADGKPLAAQVDDLDGDGRADEPVFLADLPPHAARVYTVERGGDRCTFVPSAAHSPRSFQNRDLLCRLGDKGELFLEGFGQTEILSVDFYTTNRNNLLWVNPVTGKTRAAGGAARVRFDSLSLAWVTPPAPEMVSPTSDFPLTDVALAVGILSQTPQRCDKAYEVQIARDERFDDLVAADVHPVGMRISGSTHRDRTFLPNEVLPPGGYYCRVRVIDVLDVPGEWSAVRHFVIGTADHAPRLLVREVSPRQPLFIVPVQKPQQFFEFRAAIPEQAVKEHLVAEVSYEDIIGRVDDWMEPGFPIIVKFYGHTDGNLSYLKYLYRNCPQVIGFYFGESGIPGVSMQRGLILSGKYGRLAGNYGGLSQLGLGASRAFYNLLATHGRYVAPMPKGQNPAFLAKRYGPSVGMWLIGRVGQWGVETEWWVPHHLGFSDEATRPVDWMPPFLMGLAAGAQAWRTETLISTKVSPGWPKDGKDKRLGDVWTAVVGPLYEDILKYELIPSCEAVLAQVPAAMRSHPDYLLYREEAFPAEIVQMAHGQPSGTRQWIPENSRGYLVPMRPSLAGEGEQRLFRHVVSPADFASPAEADAFFRRANPPTGGEAFCVLVGDTGVITNTRPEEGPGADVPRERFELPLSKGPVKAVAGTVGYHHYLIVKQDPDRLFIHANNYPGEQSILTLELHGKAIIEVQPKAALAAESPSEDDRRVTLTLNHQAGRTVVRVLVRRNGADSRP